MSGFEFVGYSALWVATLIGGVIWHGYVLSVLWGWFIVTIFGMAPLSIPQAMGIACIAGFMKSNRRFVKDERSRSEKMLELMFVAFLAPIVSLGFGYAIKQWL